MIKRVPAMCPQQRLDKFQQWMEEQVLLHQNQLEE